MHSALMLFAAVLGIPIGAPAPAAVRQDDPAIRIWLSDDGRYQRGDRAKVQVKAREDGYLLVLNVDPDGRLRVLFPLEPSDDALIRGGKKYEIIGRGGREAFTVDQRGRGTVYAAISRDPFRFESYVAGEHWDYAALDAVRISDKPESDLNQFVRKIARTDFDYDILGYDVYENVVYAGPATAYGYGPAFYPSYYGGWGWGGTSLFIGLGFGHRHRFFGNPFFFDPFFFNPFFVNPFFFNTFFFQPVFFVPVRPFFGFPVRRPPFGGFFAIPWRQRSGGSTFTGGFQWRGREVATRTPPAVVLASAYRGRLNTGDRAALVPMPRPTRERGVRGTTPTGSRELAAATPTRRRSLDMTPGRTEQARPNGVGLTKEPDRAPVGRRAVERPGSSAPLPQRVGPGAANARGNRAEVPERPTNGPNRMPEARPASPQIRDRNESNAAAVIRGDERGGYEGVRVMTPGAPAARRAEDDRPASRPHIERGRMESPGVRMESGDNAPPARGEARGAPAPREESRPEPRARGGSDGWGGRGGPAPRGEGWGGRGAGGAWGGGWRGRGGGGRGGGMGVGGRHR